MDKKPNILMILTDQQRYDCIGHSHDYPVKTPNIDKLADEGVWFSNAFTPIPVCCPARQSMFAGRRAETFGTLWNFNNGLKTGSLNPKDYNWIRDLKDNGYNTGHVGKWSISPEYTPKDFGFQEFISEKEYEVLRVEKYPEVKYQNGFFGEEDAIPILDSRTHFIANKSTEMLEGFRRKDEPWLLCVDFPEPHLPCRPASIFSDMYKPEAIKPWRNFNETFKNKPYIQKQQLYSWGIESYNWEDWAPIVSRYYSMVSQVDDAIGILLSRLYKMGLSENTVVIYSADHGDMCGGHKMMDKHYVLYDDIVKVPLVIKWPNKIKAGMDCSKFVCHSLDIPPTILELAGLPLKDFFQGKSLVPLLQGEEPLDWRKEVVSTYNGQQFGLYTQRMIRNTDWKYIWNTTDMDELYNLKEDPEELINVIYETDNKNIIEDLRKKLYKELIKDEDDLVLNNEWIKTQLWKGKKI